ncbi:hypothetical protein GCM10027589_05680 [Actinocorallia lasiicapitis]
MRSLPLALVALLTCACAPSSGVSGDFHPSGTTSPEPSARRAAVADGDQRPAVLTAYRGFFRAFEQALATNDASALPAFASPAIHRRITAEAREQAKAKLVKRQHNALNPRVAWLRGPEAEVIDCVVTSGLTSFDARTGRRLRPGVPEKGVLRARLTRDSSPAWKVVKLTRAKTSC